jgi:hypothetical protein
VFAKLAGSRDTFDGSLRLAIHKASDELRGPEEDAWW